MATLFTARLAAAPPPKLPRDPALDDDDELTMEAKASIDRTVAPTPEKKKELAAVVAKDIDQQASVVEALKTEIDKLIPPPPVAKPPIPPSPGEPPRPPQPQPEPAPPPPAVAARVAQLQLSLETARGDIRRNLAVARWLAGPPAAPEPTCDGLACDQLRTIAAEKEKTTVWENNHARGPLGIDMPVREPGDAAVIVAPTPSLPQPQGPQPSAYERWLQAEPQETKTRLIAQYRAMEQEKNRQAQETAAALKRLDAAAADAAGREAWARERRAELEAKRDAGLREMNASNAADAEAVADSLALPVRSAAQGVADVYHREMQKHGYIGVVGQAVDAARREAARQGAIPESGLAPSAAPGARAAAKETAVAANVLFGVDMGARAALLLTGYGVVHGAVEAIDATRELQRLEPPTGASVGGSKDAFRAAREALVSRLNDLTNDARTYALSARDLEQGRPPSTLTLPLEIQRTMYFPARRIGLSRMRPVPSPWLSDRQPGGIKFSPSGTDPSLFALDLESLHYDRIEGNLVLAGGSGEGAALINSDVVAAALLLAAQGGDPWFSLDPVNYEDWDSAPEWAMEQLRAKMTVEQLAGRFETLKTDRKIIERTDAEGRLVQSATLAAVDPVLYERLLGEKKIAAHLAFSHEFLRFTEAGRILFEADLALKQATRGAVTVGDALRDIGVEPLIMEGSGSGRGDFAPTIEAAHGPDGTAGVKDVTVLLELTARHKGKGLDDKETKVPAYESAKAKFNGNVGGVRDRVLESSYRIAQLRQFFKAYFAARTLMGKSPELRRLVLASVAPPVHDVLPDRYYDPPVVKLYSCPEYRASGRCENGLRIAVGGGMGFGGGISFRRDGARPALADPGLAQTASVAREVARGGPGVITREGRSYVRIELEPRPRLRELGEIDLAAAPKLPAPLIPGSPEPRVPWKPLLAVCLAAGLLAVAARLGPDQAFPGRGRRAALVALTLAPALLLPASLQRGGWLSGSSAAACAAFLGCAVAVSAFLARGAKRSLDAALAFHASAFVASGLLALDALAARALGREPAVAAAALACAAALVLAAAPALAALRARWRRLCAVCAPKEKKRAAALLALQSFLAAAALALAAYAVLLAPFTSGFLSARPRAAAAPYLAAAVFAALAAAGAAWRAAARVRSSISRRSSWT